MEARAALYTGEPELQLRDVELGEIQPGDVVVEMQAVGVCGSDLHVVKGEWPRPTPMILGHEGAGVIAAVGSQAAGVEVGQRVVVVWAPSCGTCVACRGGASTACVEARAAIGRGEMLDGRTGYSVAGEPVYRMTTVGAFAERVLLPATSVVAVPDALSIDHAALLGCAALTGVGAVENAARVAEGQSVVVVGAGGVGLFAVQGARLAGADPLVAVDPNRERLALARELGASATATPDELRELIAALAPGGVDHAIDAVGGAETTALAVDAARPGGRITVVGLPAKGGRLDLDAFALVTEQKTLIGSMSGSRAPAEGLRHLLELAEAGSLELEHMLAGSFPLERINEAVAASLAGTPGRVIVRPGADNDTQEGRPS